MGERTAPTDAEREASRWLVRLESDDSSLDDHRRFRAWLNASDENRAAFEAISGTWARLDHLKHLPADAVAPKRDRRGFILAGAGLAVAAAAALFYWTAMAPIGFVAYQTAIGEHTTITLADGSTSELNAGTRMRVLYSDNARRVFLERGEVLFDVQSDAARPFSVETEFGAVRVRGTSFVVKVNADDMRATVLHGVVEGEERSGGLSALLPTVASHRPSVRATANEEILFRRGGLDHAELAPQTVQRRLAWRDGMLAFDGETLREAALEVERQTGVRFTFADASLESVRVGGYISATDSEAFVQLLQENFDISAERRPGGVVVLRSAD